MAELPFQGAERLIPLIGNEHGVVEVAGRLYALARELRPSVVGAMQVTCADESERECIDAFRQRFAEHLLPRLKFGERSHFRIANLGGRYEWGAAAIAEDHFATPETESAPKLLVVKINSHVSVEHGPDGPRFGRMERYRAPSVYCGALHGLLDGHASPYTRDLRQAFGSEGHDRLATLLDEERTPRGLRGLYVALVNARVQARRALVDIQDRRPRTPTLFLVLPCVTLNRKSADTEIVCGMYWADWRAEAARVTYRGLGDDPAAYRLPGSGGSLRIEDDGIETTRRARDHREVVHTEWKRRTGPPGDRQVEGDAGPAPAAPTAPAPEMQQLLDDVAGDKHHDPHYARTMLKLALRTAAQLNPVSTAVMMFAEGVADVHHLFSVHRLARGLAEDREAREMLAEIETKVDGLPHGRARELVELLATHYGVSG